MKLILSEKNIVVILFVMVLITFSMAQEDSRKMEKIYTGINTTVSSHFLTLDYSTKKTEFVESRTFVPRAE